jgi:hypothetical protein
VPSVALDWDELGSYLPALQGVDRLFLLTPNSERQVGYVLQALAAAKRAGVKHIVRLSVMGADADPGIILGRQHFAAGPAPAHDARVGRAPEKSGCGPVLTSRLRRAYAWAGPTLPVELRRAGARTAPPSGSIRPVSSARSLR